MINNDVVLAYGPFFTLEESQKMYKKGLWDYAWQNKQLIF